MILKAWWWDMYFGSWLAVDDEAANLWIENAIEAMANVYANPSETDCREFKNKYGHKGIIKPISGEFGKFDNFMQERCGRLKKKVLL